VPAPAKCDRSGANGKGKGQEVAQPKRLRERDGIGEPLKQKRDEQAGEHSNAAAAHERPCPRVREKDKR
jgi:hypothetical protein